MVGGKTVSIRIGELTKEIVMKSKISGSTLSYGLLSPFEKKKMVDELIDCGALRFKADKGRTVEYHFNLGGLSYEIENFYISMGNTDEVYYHKISGNILF